MKNTINNIIITILLLTVASCSNDFLKDNLDIPIVPAGESTIYISPDWESADYQFCLPEVGNADFKIEAMPSWLQISSATGKLANSVASIHCLARKMSDFDKVGIYLDKIEVSVNKQTFYVPVAYLSEGNPKIEVEKEIIFNIWDYYYMNVQISNSGEGLLIWDIVSLPDWLEVDKDVLHINPTSPIIPQDSYEQLPLILNLDYLTGEENILKGDIILKTNDKTNPTVVIKVSLDLGNPEIRLYLYDNKINLGATSTTYSFDISAYGTGLLLWHLEEVPEWLTITPSKGVYRTHTSYEDIIITCDRTKLQPGLNSSVIYLKSNAYNQPSIAITVIARAPGNNVNIRELEGNIIDAAFNQNTNTLYYIAKEPNKFVAYDVVNRTVLYDLDFSKTPTCLAVSEDNKKAAIGHSEQISVVNLENRTIENLTINGTLYNIAWSEDDWFCYTTEYSDGLNWINTSNSDTYKTSDNDLYSRGEITKLPGHPYIIASRTYVSPSGLLVYSISNKKLKSYSHHSYGNFWISPNGEYLFCRNGEVYSSSDIINSNETFNAYFSPIGQLNGAPSSYYYSIRWLEHSTSAHTIWSLDYDKSDIYQYRDTDFTYQKSYFYSDLYQPEGQSAYEVEAQYLFSTNKGTELSVLRKGKNNNYWSIEFIEVTP